MINVTNLWMVIKTNPLTLVDHLPGHLEDPLVLLLGRLAVIKHHSIHSEWNRIHSIKTFRHSCRSHGGVGDDEAVNRKCAGEENEQREHSRRKVNYNKNKTKLKGQGHEGEEEEEEGNVLDVAGEGQRWC